MPAVVSVHCKLSAGLNPENTSLFTTSANKMGRRRQEEAEEDDKRERRKRGERG